MVSEGREELNSLRIGLKPEGGLRLYGSSALGLRVYGTLEDGSCCSGVGLVRYLHNSTASVLSCGSLASMLATPVYSSLLTDRATES
eukprot:3319329-Rhodomonas_salina.2